MEVTYCKLGTSQIYVSDSKEQILSNESEFLYESDVRGTNSIGISQDEGEDIYLNADINLDEAIEVKNYEGKFLKIIFENLSSGTVEFLEGDEIDLEKPLLIEYGLFSSIPVKGEEGEDWLAINTETEYDLPEIETSYFFVKNGKAIELYEEEGELYYCENGNKF
ncbi:hypothetical protein OAO52_06385 [Flavobacteriaceae bacterium]|jgi:hypothetical protein|nr:hypothetical protein [Flavobacteriaceae bacterium]